MGSAQDYSPAELLRFGQQAEAEGNLDYALKVYAYLANQFPGSTEGEVSYEGYARVEAALTRAGSQASPQPSPGRVASSQSPAAQSPGSQSAYYHPPNSAQPPTSSQFVAGYAAAQHPAGGPLLSDRLAGLQTTRLSPNSTQPSAGAANVGGGQPPGGYGGVTQASPHPSAANASAPFPSQGSVSSAGVPALHEDDAGHEPLPRMVARALEEAEGDLEGAFQKRYRAGVMIAQLFAISGWLMLACGVALALVGLLGVFPEFAVAGGSGLPRGAELGAVVFLCGLILVFVSQIGHAIFDNANATRHLLAIERAKAGY